MNKLLLVYEDYPDLMAMETTLKKVGFDVIGLTNEVSVPEHILSFNPDLVMAYGRGPKVSSLNVGKKLKDMSRWTGKSVLILPTGVKPSPEEFLKIRMDLLLDAPVSPTRAIQVIAKLLNQNEASLLDRLQKLASPESSATTAVSSSKASASTGVEEPIFVTGKVAEGKKSESVLGNVPGEGGSNLSHATGAELEATDLNLVAGDESNSGSQHDEAENRVKFGQKLDSAKFFGGQDDGDKGPGLFGDIDLSAFERDLTGGISIDGKLTRTGTLGEEKDNEPLFEKDKVPHGGPAEILKGELDNQENEVTGKIENSDLQSELVQGTTSETSSDSLDDGSVGFQDLDLEKELNAAIAAQEAEARAVSGRSDTELVTEVTGFDESINLEEISELVKADLQVAELHSAAKKSRYDQIGKDDELSHKKGTVTRVGARRRQKTLQKDFNQENIKDNDQLRRDFATALFKK